MKLETNIYSKYLKQISLFVLFSLIWGLGIVWINRDRQANQKRQIGFIWAEVVELDAHQRMAGEPFFRKKRKNNSEDSTISLSTEDGKTMLHKRMQTDQLTVKEKESRVQQTALLYINPIRVDNLKATFQKALQKEGINDSVAVSYLHNVPGNQVEYSLSDTTCLQTAYATPLVKTGVKDEILLRGYVWLPILCNTENAKILFVGWSCFVLFIGVVFYFVWRKRRVPDSIPVISDIDSQRHVYLYNAGTRKLINGDIQYDLPPFSALLLQKLIEHAGHVVEYDELIHLLWSDGTGDKPKLEQHIKILRKILNESKIEHVSIVAISGKGLILDVKENVDIRIKDL